MSRGKLILAAVFAVSVVLAASAQTRKLTVDDVLFLKSLEVDEATILKKVQDSGTTFNAQQVQQLKDGGFSDDFLSKVKEAKKPERQVRKVTAENVVFMKSVDIPEQKILTQIESSGSTFSAADVEAFKKEGFSDDFIANLKKIGAVSEENEEKEEKEKTVDVETATEKLRNDVDEMGDHLTDAAQAVEKFEGNLKKLESLKEGGILSDEEFTRSVEKAEETTGKVVEEMTLKVVDLQRAIDSAPDVKEKKAAADLAFYANQYLSALGNYVGFAHKGVPDEFEQLRKKAEDLNASVHVAHDLYSKIVEPEEKEAEKEKEEEKEEKKEKEKGEELVEKGLAGSWLLKAAGVRVDLVFGEDGSFSWHYESGDETEDIKGTWKMVDDSTVSVTAEGESAASLVPCKLIDEDTLQITIEGVTLQFNRVEEKSPKGLKKGANPKGKGSDTGDAVDLSSPEAAVTTFMRGCEAKDLDVLCQCISEIAEEELASLRDKTMSSTDLNEMASYFAAPLSSP